MQKNWYINQSGKNKGPFTAQDIIDFYDKGLIKSYQLCWRKGAKNWKPVFAVIQLARQEAQSYYETQVLKEDGQLPEIPINDVKASTETPDIPAREPVELKEVPEEESDLADIEIFPSKFPIYTTVIATFFIAVTLIASIYFAAGSTKLKKVEVQNISVTTLNEMKRPVKDGDVHLFVNKEMSTIYARLPFKKPVSVELILHRKPDLLDGSEILIKAHNIGEGGLIEFKDLVFEEGREFTPGSYNVTFIYEFLSVTDNIKNKLGMGTIREVLEKKVFLVPESRQAYLEQIAKIEKKRKTAKRKAISTIREKLRTLESLISSMSIHYRLSLSQKSGWLAHKEFQQRYARNIGPLLQSIVLSNYELDKTKLTSTELKLENEIHNLGKDISAWSAKLVEKLSRYGYLNKQKRLHLRKFMDDDRVVLQSVKNEIQKQIESLM
ncbi:DUF4339 domain-containing protein [Halobacteriovorax sp. YZS-1-1]|uniref:DUF4339 domain-containing protein n=1 Tax=unclassified Halobacteriovorax TaxID=2639665 RepID=UPI003999711B